LNAWLQEYQIQDCIKDVDFIRRGQNMKKKQTKEKWLSYLLTCTALISVTSTAHAEATISVPKTGFVTHSSTHSPLSSVYSDTAYYQQTSGKTGQELKQALHHIIDHHTELPYDAVWDALRNTDEDPTNPNNILLLYTGRSQGKFTNGANTGQWNREHVWAKSHGNFGTEKGAGTDLHHLKPADVTVNSARGNLDFDEGGTKHPLATNCKYTTTSWEPPDQVKGLTIPFRENCTFRHNLDII
jgi:endonuclease I